MILACGDLNRHYLEYLVTMAPVPVFYVHGNHDESYDERPPEGAICIDDDVIEYHGLRIAGLGGACRYRTGAWQFTEAEMKQAGQPAAGQDRPAPRPGCAGHPCAAARLRGYE